jgi:hypothetical protein
VAARKKPRKNQTQRRTPKGPVEKGVDQDLKGTKIGSHALAATARELARKLDDSKTSAHSKSMCARRLQETLDRLRELAPPTQTKDRVDELSRTRETRLRKSARRPAA